MVRSLTLTVAVLLSASVFAAEAAPAAKSVADASSGLEAARSKLAAAVKRIEKDPPETADLEAAVIAVDALKAALDAGAAFETADLDYARAVLTARRELRTQREYVDGRRANIQVHEKRRALDAVVATLNEKVKGLAGADPGQTGFDDARAALAAVKKLADESRSLTKLDPKFATYLTDVDATVAKQDKAIGDRWIALSADKQRGLLDESRKALAGTLPELAKGWSDGAFDAASKAATALEKRLEEGRPLEAGDKTYRGESDKARAELGQARKKLEEAVVAAGVQRIKNDVDPAFGDLKNSAKALRARKPTAEQLAEAKTAAFVVRKSIEKYEAQSQGTSPIAVYLTQVKATLAEVEVVLQVRSIDAARAEVAVGIKGIQKRTAGDAEFDELKAAIALLEKTLETVNAKDPGVSPTVFDARAQIKDAKAEMELRRYQVDLGAALTKLNDTRKASLALITKLQKEKPTDEQMKEAEASVVAIQTVLDEGAAFVKKDRDYALLAKDSKEKIVDYNGRIAQRKVQLQAIDARAKLTDLINAAKGSIETAKRPAGSDAELVAATKSVEAVNASIEAGAPLEKKDVVYASYAEKARNGYYGLVEQLELTRQGRELRKATGDALVAANTAFASAGSSTDQKKRKELLETAQAKLKACQEEGNRWLKDAPKLEKLEVLIGEQPSTAREAISQCAQKIEALQEPLKEVVARIRFDDGPKKAYETARDLLSKSRKDEAVAQFNDCVATGRITENRHPEYKDAKRDVAGQSLTVGELIALCVKERKAITGK